MKKYYYTLIAFSLLVGGCSKEDLVINNGGAGEIINLAPNDFDINIDSVADNSATISWSVATDPENDLVIYNIYLNGNLIVENLSELTFQFTELNELSNYSGNVLAIDSNNNETSKPFYFTTEKYYLKYLKTYNFGETDFGIGYAAGQTYSMIKTNDHNYIITGKSQKPNGNAYQFFVLKTDYDGNEIWRKLYDYQLYDSWNFKIIESSTGLILVGHHHVLSLDNDGNIIWYKKIDSYDIVDGSAEIKSVTQDSQGNIFLVGGRGSSEIGIVQEAVLTKLDNLGNILWEKAFKPSLRSFFYDIIINTSNELIVLGSTETSGTTYEEYLHGPSSVEQIDFWILKLSNEGEIKWKNTFGDGRYDFPSKIIFKSNGNYVVAGYSRGGFDINKGRIFEISDDGNEKWNVSTGLTSTYSIAETLDSGLITTGTIDYGSYNSVIGLYKFDGNGKEEWNRKYDENATYLQGNDLIVENDGGFRIAGSRNKFFFNDNDRPMIIIYKTDPEGGFE